MAGLESIQLLATGTTLFINDDDSCAPACLPADTGYPGANDASELPAPLHGQACATCLILCVAAQSQAGWAATEAELRAKLEMATVRVAGHEAAADAARKDADAHAALAAELQGRCSELGSQVAELRKEAAAQSEAFARLEAATERLEAELAAERTRAEQLDAQVGS